MEQCDIYLGLFGNEYGYEDKAGLSPTHYEYNQASRLKKYRLIFIIGASDTDRHPKMQALIRQVGNQLIRRRVNTTAMELIAGVYAALVQVSGTRRIHPHLPI